MKEHLSFSAYRGLLECPAKQVARDKGEYVFETTQAMLVGKYAEAKLCGSELPEGTLKGNGDPYAWTTNADETTGRMLNDTVIQEFLEGEQQAEFKFDYRGVNWVSIPDIINHERKRVVDIKKTANFDLIWSKEYGTKVPFYTDRDYFLQLALPALHFGYDAYLMVLTVEKPGNYDIIQLSEKDMRDSLETAICESEHLLKIRKEEIPATRCERCAYCRSTKKITEIKEVQKFQ